MRSETMHHSTITGLDSKETILIIDSNDYVCKYTLESLYLVQQNNEHNRFFCFSFNPKNLKIEKNEIENIYKNEVSASCRIVLDDNSQISLTGDTIVFKFTNCKFNECSVRFLQVGDYLPLSNCIPTSKKEIEDLNLLGYNQDRKLNVKRLIQRNKKALDSLRFLLKNKYGTFTNWKIRNILEDTSRRGVSQKIFFDLIENLNLDLPEINDHIRVVTKGKDKVPPLIPISTNFLIFTGLYLSEGNCTRNTIQISNSNENLQSKCKDFFNTFELNYYQKNQNDVSYHSVLFTTFFKTLGSTAHSKRISSIFYNINNNNLSTLLSSLFDGDGGVEGDSICYLSASIELISDIKNLLLRYNITSRTRIKKMDYINPKGELIKKKYFILTISGQENLRNFHKQIGFSLSKKQKALTSILGKKANTNVDLVPNCSIFIKKLRNKKNLSQKTLANHANCSRSYISLIENNVRRPSKAIFRRIIDFSDNKEKLSNLLNFNFRRIIRIERIVPNKNYCYNLEMKNSKNFPAGFGNIYVKSL